MFYTELEPAELVLLAVECVGRGLEIPEEVKQALGPALTADIQNPGDTP